MILVAIGGNLQGDGGVSPRITCANAVTALGALPGIELAGVSNWYRSLPFPRDDRQPVYCNGVARLEGVGDPVELLAALHRIEAGFGRTRGVLNAARTLDLDLIAYHGAVRDDPPPVLPHPRAHLRAFVLQPIIDVAPDWRHPVLGVSAAALLQTLPPSATETMTLW